ncbi:MAG: hypothetical protein NC324_02480 [Bacteroides sp.]|nr:hypothetical protein [Bacteroides sp.]
MGLLLGVGETKPEFAYDYYYGIEWDITVSNPRPTRIGRLDLHQTLPLQSKMRRCILKDDGKVNYYLDDNDSTLRDNGAAADLTGADGQYMVELPDVYVRVEQDGNKCRFLMSDRPLQGFHLWRKDYVSAVEATVQRSELKLASVVNITEDYRGGNNQSDWDELSKSQLGMPATSINLNNFRTYARNRGASEWNCYLYQTHKKLFWLFAVEYCNFNSQADFSAALTADGLRQGGLGKGVTTLNATKWNNFNSYYPIIPCGTTNSLGNHTGVVEYTLPDDYDPGVETKVGVPSYRGVENPFGHIQKFVDGCKCNKRDFYVCDDPEYFSGTNDAENYVLRGQIAAGMGFIKRLVLGEDGEIMPLTLGGGSTTFFCDYFASPLVAWSVVAFGGYANRGANAGFVYAYAFYAATNAYAFCGSRLCFYPKIE